jgi:nitrogen fixation protein FixH
MNKQVKPSKIPYFFLIFFAVFISVDIAYIFVANKTWRGVISSDTYRKGLDHNQVLQLINKQNQLGWKLNINFKNIGNKRGILRVKPLDINGQNLPISEVGVKLSRPTQEGFDFNADLEYEGDGWYQANIEFPLRGQWQFEIIVRNKQDLMQEVKKYVIQ